MYVNTRLYRKEKPNAFQQYMEENYYISTLGCIEKKSLYRRGNPTYGKWVETTQMFSKLGLIRKYTTLKFHTRLNRRSNAMCFRTS